MVLITTMLVGLIGTMFFGTIASAISEMQKEREEDQNLTPTP